jgi:hypothetical protein
MEVGAAETWDFSGGDDEYEFYTRVTIVCISDKSGEAS